MDVLFGLFTVSRWCGGPGYCVVVSTMGSAGVGLGVVSACLLLQCGRNGCAICGKDSLVAGGVATVLLTLYVTVSVLPVDIRTSSGPSVGINSCVGVNACGGTSVL